MRLISLYSNKPDVFAPISFNEGLSAVLAEIRIPENRDLDTHNLGKSTVGALLDFCLLKGKNPKFFLWKHEDRFKSFAFFLELELPSGDYLTIRRRVDPGTKIDFARGSQPLVDATLLPDDDWDHLGVPIERARDLLDGLLGLTVLQPWRFRKLVGYLVRTQQDYQDVFQLGKFSGKHQSWKPFVAHLLGAQSALIRDLYAKRTELEDAETRLQTLTREWGPEETDPSLLDGLIASRRRDVSSKEQTLEALNFEGEDRRTISDLVDRLDFQVVELNDEVYRLEQLRKRIDESLHERSIAFDPKTAQNLFKEAGVVFDGQLKKDFEQLIEFNRAITSERRQALVEQRVQVEESIATAQRKRVALNNQRAQSVAFLREADTLQKYRQTSRELSRAQAELAVLEQRREAAESLIELRRKRRTLRKEFEELQTDVEDELAVLSQDETSRFGVLRRYFAEIIRAVIDEQAVLSMTVNDSGGVDFRAELMSSAGVVTSADRGTSYRKLLCIAFDLALLRTYLDVSFPRFVYLDGALEQLDRRKRENLIEVFREYAAAGIQPVISLLDTDLPDPLDASSRTLSSGEIVLRLHDEGEDGRIFRMPTW